MWQCYEGLSGEKSRGGRLVRKGRENGGEAEKRRGSYGEEWDKWAKLMDGGYYMEEIMRGRGNLIEGGSQRLDSNANGLYGAQALLQRGVGDIIIPMAL